MFPRSQSWVYSCDLNSRFLSTLLSAVKSHMEIDTASIEWRRTCKSPGHSSVSTYTGVSGEPKTVIASLLSWYLYRCIIQAHRQVVPRYIITPGEKNRRGLKRHNKNNQPHDMTNQYTYRVWIKNLNDLFRRPYRHSTLLSTYIPIVGPEKTEIKREKKMRFQVTLTLLIYRIWTTYSAIESHPRWFSYRVSHIRQWR